jgi:GntR family transcriptional regulator
VGGASLAHRARDAILESILHGRFEGSRLPPENELADMLGVSRTTVRSALQSLEQHGVLTRSPRRGTQVHGRLSPSMVALHRLIGFARLLEESGYTVDVITTAKLTTRPPAEVTKALDVGPRAGVYQVSRLFVASGKPAVWVLNYFAADHFVSRPTDDELAQSPFDMHDLLTGGPVDHAVVELVPARAGAEVMAHLRLKAGEPYLLLKESHYSDVGLPLGFSFIHVNDHFVRFRLYRGRDGR